MVLGELQRMDGMFLQEFAHFSAVFAGDTGSPANVAATHRHDFGKIFPLKLLYDALLGILHGFDRAGNS